LGVCGRGELLNILKKLAWMAFAYLVLVYVFGIDFKKKHDIP